MEGMRRMADQKAKTLSQEFCRAWFERRDPEETLAFLTEDVAFVGTGEGEYAQGKAEMARYLQNDILEISEPFSYTLSWIHEQAAGADTLFLSAELTLKNTVYAWRLRVAFVLVREERSWKIKSLYFSEPSSNQRDGEHYPWTLAMENTVRQRRELLNDSLAGGMMGGYLEPGFPFYFINRRMLEYLGYENEEEFVADIKGLISNCMHPGDREMIDQAVADQLAENGEYVVEYRMKKKDGSYIWVHDMGRRMISEDGRPAITSVCIDITAQKSAQEEVLHLYNNIPGAVLRCRLDPVFSIIDANDGFFEFLGYTREEFAALGNHMTAVIYPDDLLVMRDKMKEQLRRGNTLHGQDRLVCKGGVVKWVSMKSQLITEKDGEQYFYCVFVDITEEKLLQDRMKELYETELSYFAKLSDTGGCIQGRINITQNRMETYLSTSDVAVAHVGDTYDKTIGNFSASAVDTTYGEVIRSTLKKEKVLADYAAGKVDYNFEFLRKRNGGGAFWGSTSFRSCLNPETGDVIVFFYTFDITERKLQEMLLDRIVELDYEYIMEIDVPQDSYWLISFDENRQDAVSGKGSFQEEIRTIAERFMDAKARGEYLEKLDYKYMEKKLEHQDTYSFVVEINGDQGENRIKRFQVFYIDKRMKRVCLARTDVTDLVRQEQQQKKELSKALAAAKRAIAAISAFLSCMSHDIRTPMNAVIGMTTLAVAHLDDRDKVADCLQKITASSKYLLSLINDILDMSKIEQSQIVLNQIKISLSDLLRQLSAMMAPQAYGAGLKFQIRTEGIRHKAFLGDNLRVNQILINILSNAIKFTPPDGRVDFLVKELGPVKGAQFVRYRFTIQDTGIGMPEEFLRHLFDPFTRSPTAAKIEGTGLGLSITKGLVDLMGGVISVDSWENKGTTFQVELEFLIAEEEPEPSLETRREPLGIENDGVLAGRRFLIAEDNAINAEILCGLLELQGAKFTVTKNGAQVVQTFRDTLPGVYDGILMDIQMPEMNGYQATQAIRKLKREDARTIPIIAMTANAFAEDIEKSLSCGMNAHVAKPIDINVLRTALQKVLYTEP